MVVTIDQIDVIEILSLERILPPGEVEEIVEVLNKEIWYRVLHEVLPKYITKEEYKTLVAQHESDKDLVLIMKKVSKNWPNIPMERLALETTRTVKREFIENYLKEVLAKHANYQNGKEIVTQMIKEIRRSEISSEKLDKLRNEFYRLATS